MLMIPVCPSFICLVCKKKKKKCFNNVSIEGTNLFSIFLMLVYMYVFFNVCVEIDLWI